MKKKKAKKKNSIKKSNIFLVIVTSLIFIGGFAKTVIAPEPINYYENRTAYNYEKPTTKTIVNKEFQDNIELTLGDQIPMATTMKKGYNSINAITNYNIMKKITSNYCKDNYVAMLSGLTTYGCDDTIVYYPRELEQEREKLDLRINNINKAIESTKAEVYIYYIEKDTDIQFNTQKQTAVSEYITSNVNTKNTHVYEINNFEEFQRDFYKTDHHWNLDGSYRGYLELTELLDVKTPLNYGDKNCINESFVGSKATVNGASVLFKEDFCTYDYELPEHTITINGEESTRYSFLTLKDNPYIGYANYYGGDYGEIIFDYNQKKKDNILIFGESYDNAILELIASHYNKTYSIDLRNYERENGKKFNYKQYIQDNDIDKIIFIGNIDFFVSDVFNVEVK